MPDYLHHFHLVRRMRKLCIGIRKGEEMRPRGNDNNELILLVFLAFMFIVCMTIGMLRA